jgi:hypothetical protein
MGEIVFIPDLSAYVCAFKWAVPLRAVGWLECPYPYATGTAPLGLAEKLAALIAQPIIISMGCDVCSLCAESGTETTGFIWSRIVYIPGDAEVFVVPGGVVHYVESHTYLPPGRSIEAVFLTGIRISWIHWPLNRLVACFLRSIFNRDINAS